MHIYCFNSRLLGLGVHHDFGDLGSQNEFLFIDFVLLRRF